MVANQSIAEQFNAYADWRRSFAPKLRQLADWLRSVDLLDAAVTERLQRIESRANADKVTVAFVAEFSRGKSELINALFFAEYKRRIMPATAGRTTMCPTELGYDADFPPCIRLLPIQSRLEQVSLMDLRLVPERWVQFPLDLNNPAQMAAAFERVAEVLHVTVDEARALGFWHDDKPDDNPPVTLDGTVEVPKWRHALINFSHPLLKQGLTILDTPGLNAIGAEPELTVSLIPQAQAVLFILAADTGVTKSDLNIWQEHLISEGKDARLVVLNKIDTMWDALSTPQQIDAAIRKQRETTAQILSLDPAHVLAVSAQKGLVAKVNGDAALLERSHLHDLERVLGQGLLSQREQILRGTIGSGMQELRTEALRVIAMRRRDQSEQVIELRGLRGKNGNVIRHMRERVVQEHKEFEESLKRIHAVRSVHLKLLREVFALLSSNTLRAELAQLNQALRGSGIKLGVSKIYSDTFTRMRVGMVRAQECSVEIHTMLSETFKQLNAEFAFSLQAPDLPDLDKFLQELKVVEQSHQQYLGMGNLFRLAQTQFVERLVRALASRLRVIFESAQSELELWNKSAAAQLDTQLKERRRAFEKRIDAIDRIQEAAVGLDGRIEQMDRAMNALDEIERTLHERTTALVQDSRFAASDPSSTVRLAA